MEGFLSRVVGQLGPSDEGGNGAGRAGYNEYINQVKRIIINESHKWVIVFKIVLYNEILKTIGV